MRYYQSSQHYSSGINSIIFIDRIFFIIKIGADQGEFGKLLAGRALVALVALLADEEKEEEEEPAPCWTLER